MPSRPSTYGVYSRIPHGVGKEVEPEILSLLGRGEEDPGDQAVQGEDGRGLKEAKDAVEALAQRHGLTPKATGCAGLFLLALGLCVALSVVLGCLV